MANDNIKVICSNAKNCNFINNRNCDHKIPHKIIKYSRRGTGRNCTNVGCGIHSPCIPVEVNKQLLLFKD